MLSDAKIHVYKGEWGLPSIDFECIRTLCLIKFSEAPIDINFKVNPFFSKNGKLPYLEVDGKKILGYKRIGNFLESKGYIIRPKSTDDEKFLCNGYEIIVQNNLYPYFYYTLFGDPRNIDDTRMLYAKRTPFPFSFYYPGKFINIADDIMEVYAGFSVYEPLQYHMTDTIITNAKKCINMLSEKLGNQTWFFGNEHSELDALVYSYISILYNITLASNPLKAHIGECPNLVQFIERITKRYFSKEGFSSKANEPKTTDSNTKILTPSERQFAATKRKTQILAAIGAIIAMSSYATWLGLLQLTYDNQYDDTYSYEDDNQNLEDHS